MSNENIKQGRIPRSTMRLGAFLAIIVGIFTTVIGGIISITLFSTGNYIYKAQSDMDNYFGPNVGKMFHIMAIIFLIVALLNIPAVIANIMLVKGKLNSSVIPGVLVIISLGIGIIGIFCGVIILMGKFEDQIDNMEVKNEDFLQRNFNFSSRKTTKNSNSEQASSWRDNPPANSSQSSTVESEVISKNPKAEKKK